MDCELRRIKIGNNRQRREFDPDRMYEQKCSIAARGLLHAIVVRSEDDKTLVAGERRLRNMAELIHEGQRIKYNGELLPEGHVPYTVMGDLSEEEYEEAELEENVQRVDLTWQEKAAAISRLHKLRVEQDPKHTAAATVEEILGRKVILGEQTRLVRDNQILADHLDDEEVAAAKTKKEAMKIVKRKAKEKEIAKRSEVQSARKSEHTLLRGSCVDLLPTLDAVSVDCIITDPPYGVDASNFGSQSGTGHHYEDSSEYAMGIVESIANEGYRICKPQAHLYMFCDIQHFDSISAILSKAGWTVWKWPLIWCKRTTKGMLPRPEHGPRRTYEAIIFANKGDRRTQLIAPDLIHIDEPMVPVHAAEKPVELYQDLLERSCIPGDCILDPCAGSGPVFPVANRLQLVATGINLDEKDYALANSRLEEK